MEIVVYKHNTRVKVLLLPHKDGSGYTFVNVTRGHICPCVFATVKDALADLDKYVKTGKVKSYRIVSP